MSIKAIMSESLNEAKSPIDRVEGIVREIDGVNKAIQKEMKKGLQEDISILASYNKQLVSLTNTLESTLNEVKHFRKYGK